ncbi:MAG: hypothetical protein HY286_00635 [Planctomycetes bacterium]|nr:hypothetical protein [Planctomycetota bacterium]
MNSTTVKRIAFFVIGLVVFIFALELIKKGAGGLKELFAVVGVHGIAGALGFGWLMACVVLSGSPVAAISLALLAGGTLNREESFAMIAGSRLGASFVVLLIGAIDDLRNRRQEKRSSYVGVAAILVTAIVYIPALLAGYVGLERGVFEGLQFEGRALNSAVDFIYGPITRAIVSVVPRFIIFIAGVLTLLAGLKMFDKALPDFAEGEGPVGMKRGVIYRPWVMFLFGLAVTSLTMSVSVSISILVPLTAKGHVRRENLFPYMLGANITTFIDTLFAGALVGHPDAVRIVALIMVCVTILSLPIVFIFPYAFERFVDRVARRVTSNAKSLLFFVALLFGIPAALIFIF